MSPRAADPARTYALLIGIEAYAAGRDWELDGPAGDVREMYAWLVSQGVPEDQIEVLASPLPQNQARLANAKIKYEPAVSSVFRDKVEELHKKEGDLLVLFWAGHGAYNDQEHRLFFADATTDDKRNVAWNRLRESLLSDFFAGFSCQIVIVDACADIRDDLIFTAAGEPIRAGRRLQPEQFVLFATLIGQAAANLDREQRGLFSKQLLKQLQSDAFKIAWPPDMPKIAATVREEFQKLQGASGLQIPRFESYNWEGGREVFAGVAAVSRSSVVERDRLALVIGISKYQHFVQDGQKPEPHQFVNLEFGSADARAVHGFLSERLEYEVLPPLLDEQATLRGILRGLNTLRRMCEQSKRTAVVYFSGHGARDEDNRSYLVPHDALKDDLFSTALWTRMFSSLLEEFGQNRVVLLIDACHGGDFEIPGAKGGQLTGFNPQKLTEGSQAGQRFLIASCQPQQQSYEGDGNGIFTQQLLGLLRSDDPSMFPAEEIDLFDLYSALKPLVRTAASNKKRAAQDPFASFAERTGFIVAVNEALRRERVERPVRYIAALVTELARQQYNQRLRLEALLQDYIDTGERQQGYTKFYELFDENLRNTDPRNTVAIGNDCRYLIKFYELGAGDSKRPQVSVNNRPGSERAVQSAAPSAVQDATIPASPTLDSQLDVTAKSLLGAAPGAAAAPLASDDSRSTPVSQAGPPAERRVLTLDDVTYIMGDTLKDKKDPAFKVLWDFMKKLQADEGVLESDGDAWMFQSAKKIPADREASIQEMLGRFQERFQQAKPIASASALYLRVGKTD